MNYIKKRRHELGLNQKDIAFTLDVTTSTVSLWEKGRKPTAKFFPELADILQVSVEQLMEELGIE